MPKLNKLIMTYRIIEFFFWKNEIVLDEDDVCKLINELLDEDITRIT